MAKRPNKNTLGPRFKISVPKFGFEDADREQRYVEDLLQAHKYDSQDLINKKVGSGVLMKKQLKPLNQGQQQQQQQQLPPYSNNNNNRRVEQDLVNKSMGGGGRGDLQ